MASTSRSSSRRKTAVTRKVQTMPSQTEKIQNIGRNEIRWVLYIVGGVVAFFLFFSDHFATAERVCYLEAQQSQTKVEMNKRLDRIDQKLDLIQRDMMKAGDK